jgi:sulfate permease, SulP family
MMFVENQPGRGRPKLFSALQHYDRRQAVADLIAGVTVGLVALPLALAFAISSGLTPQAGIYTAIVAGALISFLGGSRCQIGGPTGAFVVIVAGIVAKHGVEGLFVCTLMAGGMLVVLGATGMGSAVKFIPRPVVVGFTNGIAVLIASTQIRDFLGLTIETVPTEFLPRMQLVASRFWTWSPPATGLAVAALALSLVVERLSKQTP